MNYDGGVQTGRTLPRSRYECHSCQLRNAVGTPKSLDTWAMRLHGAPLTSEQVDLLLVAAAEFRDLCEESGEYADAVSFVDWVRPDALAIVVNFTVSSQATEDRHRGIA
jgi:hypothetical protein